MSRILSLATVLIVVVPIFTQQPKRVHSNLDRLKLERLASVNADVVKLRGLRVALPGYAGLTDFRCIFHAHAEDSTHTGGTLPEMLADAKKAGVHAIFLADHYRPPRDFMNGRWRGLKDGVLFIPGSEVNGFLVHPMDSILHRMNLKGEDFISTVNAGEGLIFLSHIEERHEHPVIGLTGLEIYNRHWDAKRDPGSMLGLVLMLTDAKSIAQLQKALELYPDELLAFQCDYPDVYLAKWDAGTRLKRLTGVAANDCHHNQIYLIKMVDEKTVRIGTNVDADQDMQLVSAALRPGIRELTRGHQPGEVLARLDFDPYYRSFRNSSTHIIAAKLEEQTLRVAVKAGHVYVAHDWMADPTGLRFDVIYESQQVGMMGDERPFREGLSLAARLPVPAYLRLIHNGREVARFDQQAKLQYRVKEPGIYRLEAWLKLDGELRPWVYTNPIYLRDAKQ